MSGDKIVRGWAGGFLCALLLFFAVYLPVDQAARYRELQFEQARVRQRIETIYETIRIKSARLAQIMSPDALLEDTSSELNDENRILLVRGR